MEDYKNLVERLREDPKDSRKAVLSIYDLCVDAALAIEILLDKLKYAEGERDTVTKRMIELEALKASAVAGQETLQMALATANAERYAAINSLDEALIMDNQECFDGENFPCGYRPWCDLCDDNEERGCAKAYMAWRGQKKEA